MASLPFTAAKYGVGAGFLFNTFLSFMGDEDSGFGMDNILSWAETLGFDADFLKNGILPDLIKGREGPLSLLAGALTIFPEGTKKYGVYAALLWAGVSLYQDHKKGELQSVFSGATGSEQTAGLEAQRRAEFLAGIDVDSLTSSTTTLAQVDGQNIAITPQGIVNLDDDDALSVEQELNLDAE